MIQQGDDRTLEQWTKDQCELALRRIDEAKNKLPGLEADIQVVMVALVEGPSELGSAWKLASLCKILQACAAATATMRDEQVRKERQDFDGQ